MSLSRSTLGASFLKPFLRRSTVAAPLSTRISTSVRTYATQDYGSGDGNPAGENPQDQGSNPSADLEHPGPPPPSAGQGSGGGPTKGSSGGHNTSENSSSPDKSSSSSSGGSDSKSATTKGAQPKILSESPPAPEDQSEEVKQHNKDMDNRAEQANEKVEDYQGVDKEKKST